MASTILEIKELSKRYGNLQALDRLSIQIEAGSVFGLLGPNGSGKTTTLGILLGVINANSGSYSWFGNGTLDVNRYRIGALLETPNFYPYLSAVRNLRIVGRIKRLKDIESQIERVLRAVNLWERKDATFKTFSLGMKQRLAIASALLSDPEVLVLDEPTNGLDPQGIAEIRNLIREVASRGKTIVLASHQLDEVEKVCTEVAILKKGKLIMHSPVAELIGATRQIVVIAEKTDQLKTLLSVMNGVSACVQTADGLVLTVSDQLTGQAINQHCFDNGIVLSGLKETRKSLEEQFLEITRQV